MGSAEQSDHIDRLRSALESMCEQYLTYDRDDDFHHMFMSAGEEACDVLCDLFPDRWELTGDGARRTPTPAAVPPPEPTTGAPE